MMCIYVCTYITLSYIIYDLKKRQKNGEKKRNAFLEKKKEKRKDSQWFHENQRRSVPVDCKGRKDLYHG